MAPKPRPSLPFVLSKKANGRPALPLAIFKALGESVRGRMSEPPVRLMLPATWRVVEGLVVPMPTWPLFTLSPKTAFVGNTPLAVPSPV